jgi:small subunit ribosomal protein S20
MPIIKSAKKKMRKDATRTARNKNRKDSVKALTKAMRRTPDSKNLSALSSALDKAVKVNLIHKNKAARLKSRLSHLIAAK